MARQRIVNTNFYRDRYILTLDTDARFLFLWAITNPATDLCGAYESPLPIIEVETGMKSARILEIFEAFMAAGKMLYKDGWVIIQNFSKHQNTTSTNIQKGIERSLSACPDWVKETLREGINTPSVATLPRPEPEPEPYGINMTDEILENNLDMSEAVSLLTDAFPNVRFTPAAFGFVEAAVTGSEIDQEAWRQTIELYQMNYDPLLKRYMPDKIGNVLKVYEDMKAKVLNKNATNKHNPKTDSAETRAANDPSWQTRVFGG